MIVQGTVCVYGDAVDSRASGITLPECKSVFANREGKVWDLSILYVGPD